MLKNGKIPERLQAFLEIAGQIREEQHRELFGGPVAPLLAVRGVELVDVLLLERALRLQLFDELLQDDLRVVDLEN